MGSAFASPLQSMGNTMYFGDPLMTGKQYLMGVAMGGLFGGAINGGIALNNGRTFFAGNLKGIGAGEGYVPSLKFDEPDFEIKPGKLKLDNRSSTINNNTSSSKVHYFENAKGPYKYSDGVPSGIYRDPNFRSNLINTTGIDPGKAAQAHHVFSLKYTPEFQAAGINPNSYGAWWGTAAHQSNAVAYNNAWGTFFRANPGANYQKIMQEAARLKLIFGY